VVTITCREFHRNAFSIAKQKDDIWHGMGDGTDGSGDRPGKHNVPVQQRQRRHNWSCPLAW